MALFECRKQLNVPQSMDGANVREFFPEWDINVCTDINYMVMSCNSWHYLNWHEPSFFKQK